MRMRQYIHQSNLLEGIDSEEADERSLNAWERLSEFMAPGKVPTHEIILATHERITGFQADSTDVWPGAYRSRSHSNVQVGDYIAPEWHLVDNLMAEWIRLWPTRSPKENHIAFEKIHPFNDGNGRTGRMLMWAQQVQQNRRKTYFSTRRAKYYYNWFNEKEA